MPLVCELRESSRLYILYKLIRIGVVTCLLMEIKKLSSMNTPKKDASLQCVPHYEDSDNGILENWREVAIFFHGTYLRQLSYLHEISKYTCFYL